MTPADVECLFARPRRGTMRRSPKRRLLHSAPRALPRRPPTENQSPGRARDTNRQSSVQRPLPHPSGSLERALDRATRETRRSSFLCLARIGRSRGFGERERSRDISLSLSRARLVSCSSRRVRRVSAPARQRVQARRCVSDVVHVPVALRATRPVRGVSHCAHIRAATRARDLCHCEACGGRVYRRSPSAR
jgi:hypothetical protein